MNLPSIFVYVHIVKFNGIFNVKCTIWRSNVTLLLLWSFSPALKDFPCDPTFNRTCSFIQYIHYILFWILKNYNKKSHCCSCYNKKANTLLKVCLSMKERVIDIIEWKMLILFYWIIVNNVWGLGIIVELWNIIRGGGRVL